LRILWEKGQDKHVEIHNNITRINLIYRMNDSIMNIVVF